MSLQDYLPRFYREYEEMCAILQTEDAAFAALYDAIPLLLDENTIAEASEETIARWEERLALVAVGSLPQRKMVV